MQWSRAHIVSVCSFAVLSALAGAGCGPGHAAVTTPATVPSTGTSAGDDDDDSAGTGTGAGTGAGTDTASGTAPTSDECPRVTAATRAMVVTDIDETLTTSDTEWLTQIAVPSHDPEMRPDADEMMRRYVAKGYRVVYVTARGEDLSLLDGTSAREATEAWLTDHGFPFTSDGVFLADGLGAIFDSQAVAYKTEVLEELIDYGFDLLEAYGNADTDIDAYQAVGIPPEDTFLVGRLAGQLGVTGIPTDEAYTQHLADFVDGLPCGY